MTLPSPDCPGCGHPPLTYLLPLSLAFCTNEACGVLSWNPELTPAQLRATEPTAIDLRRLKGPDPTA